MGLLDAALWKASWIGVQVEPPAHLESDPSPLLRKRFNIQKPVKSARAYVTAKGIYELHLNGQRIGDDYFSPGWTDYSKRIQYQVHDVTDLLKPGDNAIGAMLASGWYCGHAGPFHRIWGKQPRFLSQLHIQFTDGSTQTIASDSTWQATLDGAIRSTDMLQGEHVDSRSFILGWSEASFDDSKWKPVDAVEPLDNAKLVCSPGPRVRAIQTLLPVAQTEPSPGVHVFDMGQNMVGVIRLKARGPAGTKITLRHAEVLNPDGTLYIANLRAAKCIDTFTLSGGEECLEPRFTFHGFRYIELTGCAEKPTMSDIAGVVLHSDMRPTGEFECSNPLVNQLQHNIVWGQKGNFLDVPTDCPQRDERLGWTGDGQVFARTACFNFDVAAFMTKWMIDVVDAQRENGCYTDVAPDIGLHRDAPSAWADAGIIVPWTIYLCYGDHRMLERHYPSMQRFIQYYKNRCPDLVFRGNTYGDWLNLDAYTSCDLIGTAFFAHSTELMSRIARVLGKDSDVQAYRELAQQVKDAFNREFVTPSGRVSSDTQTAYVLALAFDLLPMEKREAAVKLLRHDITEGGFGHAPLVNTRKGHLSTGFVGVKDLNPTLTRFGELDLAYQLLNNEDYPSWLYPVKHGATTIWERWDGWTEAKGFQDPGMNSFNHYAYGAIGQWLYATVAGIDIDPDQPGYKRILIQPLPGGGLTWARGQLDSMYGRISSHWIIENDIFRLKVTIPPNTTARMRISNPGGKPVREGNVPLERADGVRNIRHDRDATICEVAAGSYVFSVPR